MAVNLNPGGDATLIAAATRASMAGVPKDQSQIWQNMSVAQGKAYEAWGEAGSKAASLFMQHIGGEMVEAAYKQSSLKQGVDTFVTGSKFTGTAKEDFSQAIKNHRIRRDGGEINGETIEGWKNIKDKEKRKEAKKQWEEQGRKNLDQYMKHIKNVETNTEMVANGLANIEATGGVNALKQGALQANGDWFGKEEGNRVRMRSGIDKNGDLQFYLESEKGGYISGVNADGSYEIETTYDDAGAVVTGGPKGDKPLPKWATPEVSTDENVDPDAEVTSQKTNLENLSQVVNNLPQSIKSALTNLPTSEEDVKALQNDLLSLGYKLPKFGADGKMGNETRGAVLDFQNDLNNVNNVISQVGQKRLTVKPNEVNSLITTVDQEKRNALNQLDLNALSGKMPYRKNATANQVLDILGNDANAWRDAFNARLADNDKTYAEMLKEPSDLSATVFESLAGIGAKDANNDGNVDAKDFIGNSADVQRNMAIMTNTLLDPSNPLAKKAFADWYSDTVGQSALAYLDSKSTSKSSRSGGGGGFNKKNAATVISMNDAGDGTIASYNNKSPIDNLDVGVNDVVFSNDIIAGITGRNVGSEIKGYSFDYKIGKDGILYASDDSGDKGQTSWTKSAINEEKYNDQYNKIVKYLADNKIAALDYKGVVIPEGSTTDLSNMDNDSIVDQILGDNENVTNLNNIKKKYVQKNSDFSLLTTKNAIFGENKKGRRQLTGYLFSYADDNFVAGTLNRHFNKDGFTFDNTSQTSDGVTAYYKDSNGKTHNKFFETNFQGSIIPFTANFGVSTDDKKSAAKLQDWMMQMINEDIERQSTYKGEGRKISMLRGQFGGLNIT